MLSVMAVFGAVLVWAGGTLLAEGSIVGGAQGMMIMGVSLAVAGIGAAVALLPALYMRARRPAPPIDGASRAAAGAAPPTRI